MKDNGTYSPPFPENTIQEKLEKPPKLPTRFNFPIPTLM